MSLARANAARWHVDRERLGVIGFSAGGALAALLSFGRLADAAAEDPGERTRPAFSLLLYPSGFNSSEFAANWRMPLLDARGALQRPLQPLPHPPPTFIAVAQDDDVVGASGAVELWSAVRRSSGEALGATAGGGAPSTHALHVFAKGGHSFGVCLPDRGGGETAFSTTCAPPRGCPGIDACAWPTLAQRWLTAVGVLPGEKT
eukprot:4975682-Prymnesium_polylepis.1